MKKLKKNQIICMDNIWLERAEFEKNNFNMKITLSNSNEGKDYKIGQFKFNLFFVERENELLILTEDGKEIGFLEIEIMNDGEDKATKNYWLNFVPKKCDIGLGRNCAEVWNE